MARAQRLVGASTGAIVTCYSPVFENAAGEPDANSIAMSMDMKFNGDVSELSDRVTFARNATNAEKQAAVRSRVNALLSDREPGVTLNNANIQISGLPV